MSVDAIIVAYRSSEVIADCVSSLTSDQAVERVIVVNNSPGDATAAVLKPMERVIYLEASENVGYASAVNLARSAAIAPYVVLANPDTVQAPGTTTALLDFMSGHPGCAVVAPTLHSPAGDLERNSQHDLSLMRMVFQATGWPERAQVMRSHADHLYAHPTECVIAAFVLCRVSALDEIEWFDDSIFLFGEDQDLCRRLRASGWEIWFAPVGDVRHIDGHSWRQLSDQGTRLFREARYRELRKATNLMQAQGYRALVAARSMPAALARGLRHRPS